MGHNKKYPGSKGVAVFTYLAAYVIISVLTRGHVIDGQVTTKTNASNAAGGTEYVGVARAVQFNGTEYVVARFLGIQYAAAPVGEKRFSKPEPYVSNVTSYSATQSKAACHQPVSLTDKCLQGQNMAEDCLYLNVYVPTPTLPLADVKGNTSATVYLPDSSRAVYVYIHGGGFFEGSGNCNDGSVLAAYGDIIYVTFNYRLGALGFLATDDGVIPANVGLWDQQAAIAWVSQNIRAFGGDPKKITVGGQSAGGLSSILQGLYPGNDKLFKRVVSQSGPGDIKSVLKSGYRTALTLANMFGCNVTGPGRGQDIKTCLKKQNASVLSRSVVPLELPLSLVFSPIVDGDMVKMNMVALFFTAIQLPKMAFLPEGFLNKDMLVGFTAEDGEVIYRLRALQMYKESNNMTILTDALSKYITMSDFKAVVIEYFSFVFNDTVNDLVVRAVLDRYVDRCQLSVATYVGYQMVKMMTDIDFAVPVLRIALGRSLAKDSNANYSGATYVYRLNLPATNYYYQTSNMPWLKGTSHSDDLNFVFGRVNDSSSFDISKSVMTYWTNFVKTGNPNTPYENQTSTNVMTIWPNFTSANQEYLDISAPSVFRQHLQNDSRYFWDEYLTKLYNGLSASSITTSNVTLEVCPNNNPTNTGTRLISVQMNRRHSLLWTRPFWTSKKVEDSSRPVAFNP
ncbi:hypothetical protein Btru_001474 [Bulinus truncatus]|nr:hypothetical protein Btru_001474 [Bulinus truncatus]